jgi:acetylornithine deacetylase/succinyl-diaminopimelate desuccinylase-like protein
MEAAYSYLEDKLDAHIERIQEFVRQPTISTEDIGIVEGAWLLKGYLEEAGFDEVELVETDGYPGIWASIDVGAPRTIASYGFFDSRPVGPRQWTYQPFCGALVEQPENGRVLVGRGSSSPKGPLVAWVNSLEALIQTGELPVNVMLLIEGEEILGSPHYPDMFERYRSRLEKADAAFTGGMTQAGSGAVAVNLGYRGFLVLELEVSGKAWGRGPVDMPLHSSLKNVTHSPPSRLSHVLASLTDDTGANIAVEGLEEPILDPTEEDLELIEQLLDRFGEDGVKAALGLSSTSTVDNMEGRELLMDYLYRPSLNINGLYSGYTGPGAEVFTVPERAVARLDLRLPPGLTCEHALDCLKAQLQAGGFEDVELSILAAHDWSRTSVESTIAQAVLETYRSYDLDPPVWPYRGGGGPWSLYRTELGIPLLNGAGLGGGGRRDRGDEYLVIDGHPRVASLLEAEQSHVDILGEYARIS